MALEMSVSYTAMQLIGNAPDGPVQLTPFNLLPRDGGRHHSTLSLMKQLASSGSQFSQVLFPACSYTLNSCLEATHPHTAGSHWGSMKVNCSSYYPEGQVHGL